MIGEERAGGFTLSVLGRSGGERREALNRRQVSTPVVLDRRVARERRRAPDRRLLTDAPEALELPEDVAPSPPPQLDAVADHRRVLSAQVGRDIGQDVATLDYLLNIRPGSERPAVIDRAVLADIEHRAMTDALTGLFNRGFLDSTLRREIARCRRHGVMTSLILIDLDEFKGTNDRWGHAAGDAALGYVAEVIRRRLRVSDVPCRYGGDEFAVVLPDTYRRGALLVGERIVGEIRRAFERGVPGCRPALTVSVGVAWYGAKASTHAELLEAADGALYAAQAAGGDQVAQAS